MLSHGKKPEVFNLFGVRSVPGHASRTDRRTDRRTELR